MVGLSEAALVARLVRVAASVGACPLAALFRLEGERASLIERVVRLEEASEITQMTLPAARLTTEACRIWLASSRASPPTELAAFPSAVRVRWAVSLPLFDASRAQIGLLVVADATEYAEPPAWLPALEDVRVLLEERLTRPLVSPAKATPDRQRQRILAPALVHGATSTPRPGSLSGQRDEPSSERLIPSDAVTGLLDRASLFEEASRRIERASVLQLRVALVTIALDRFRRVNETLGIATGDAVLRQVGERLRESVGDGDVVGRRSGDEFIVLVSDDGSFGSTLALADRLQQTLREPFYVPGHEVTITASLGVACFPSDAADAPELFQSADIALARAKQLGQGKLVVFDPTMREAVTERVELERELRIAMREGQLLLHYQPKFRVRDRVLVGAEALLRWRHPTKGLVPPGRFIPAAEDSALIVPIGAWVLSEACRHRASWHREGLDVGRISVNVSALQFGQRDFVGSVTRAIRSANLEPGQLELELTESIAVGEAASVAERLHAIRALGVRVSIDDFGTGYSSLSYLQRLPLDVLKIDRAFVAPLDRDEEQARGARAIAGAIATLARGLGLEVLAEGVETEAQFEILASLGCDVIQGYLLGRPMPVEEFSQLARRGVASTPSRS